MKKADGYCIKSPIGSLWLSYFNANKKKVVADARDNIAGADGHRSWAKLHRQGYRVVRVRVKTLEELA